MFLITTGQTKTKPKPNHEDYEKLVSKGDILNHRIKLLAFVDLGSPMVFEGVHAKTKFMIATKTNVNYHSIFAWFCDFEKLFYVDPDTGQEFRLSCPDSASAFTYYQQQEDIWEDDIFSLQEIINEEDGYTLSAVQVAAYWCEEHGLDALKIDKRKASRRNRAMYKQEYYRSLFEVPAHQTRPNGRMYNCRQHLEKLQRVSGKRRYLLQPQH